MGVIVLAGGRSERMGQDKALLTRGGRTLLEQTLLTVSEISSEIIVVADRADRYPLAIGRGIADRFPGAGPLGGVITGLELLGEGNHLVTACDMPSLQTSVLRYLLSCANEEADCVVPLVGGRLEPLCAVYQQSALVPLRAYFEEGERALHRSLRRLRLRTVPEEELRAFDPELRCFRNLNTPEEAAEWIS
ncbi:MAG: molybdenum cofactor guanylyltransferase [Armatimonadetes bacterium]|nr:molybdenum cofactor guanylyltransferase [Armatimonadota bacterium]